MKNLQYKNKYSIGLDIGTTSVGWAVINPNNFEVMKGKTYRYNYNCEEQKSTRKTSIKSLWGVRLFEEALTAKERRTKRSTRRRYDRRRQRIKLLQEEFREEINNVDKTFFKKLKDSFYSPLDKHNQKELLTEEDKRKVFSNYIRDIKINEKKTYPTIYHLRYALMNNKEKMDIRQVYLGIHHIIKYRGNFLYNNALDVDQVDIKDKLKESFAIYDNLVIPINIEELDDKMCKTFETILFEKSKNDIKKKLEEELRKIIDNKSKVKEFVKLLIGDKFNLLILFDVEKQENNIESISFKGNDYENNSEKLESLLEDKIDSINSFKDLYNLIFIKKMFSGSKSNTISELMIEYYDKHEKDLKKLKQVLKQNKEEYNKVFRTTSNKCLYDEYITNNIEYTEFKNKLSNSLNKIIEQEDVLIIKEELEKETFLPRITSTDNGKYPYQFNQKELKKIIENQGEYYPFLKREIVDESGKNIYKLEKLLSFRIPYYVGPLNQQTSEKGVLNKNAWLIRNNEYKTVQITPYNFHKVINKEKTAEAFIERMVGQCTYINGASAMPLNSIYYSKYKVVSELKQITVNNIKLKKEHILDIYNDLFLKRAKINKNDLEQYLRNHIDYKFFTEYDIKGFQENEKFASNMKSYLDFFGEKGILNETNYTETDAENIIRDITIFEDKQLLKSRLENNYPELTKSQITRIIKLQYKGWSSISKMLLATEFYQDEVSKKYKSIMDLMLETNENFMQIINNKKYKIQDKINELNNIEKKERIDYEIVKELSTSPSNKRGIYQALKVVEEIVDYMGYNPESISIEMARGEGKNGRTSSRKEQLQRIYNSLSNQIDNYEELKKQLLETSDIELNKEKVFLYFLQCGKSLYSMEPLSLENLDKMCEIDHIIPQSLIKDDSIDNKALVLKNENAVKRASYVLPVEFRKPKTQKWWNQLHEINDKLMSNKKLFALTREKYTRDQIEGFINRQLVETRQICKHVANILNTYYTRTKIIYLNSNLSSNYRKKFELYKFRELNDYHHAHDAYLAGCLGIYQEKFVNKNIDFSELKELSSKWHEGNNYKDLNYGYIVNSLDDNVLNVNIKTGEIFNNREFNKIVKETLYRNDIMVTKKNELKTGKFYKETIYSHKSNKAHYELKNNLPVNLYGGYDQLRYSYMMLIKYKDSIRLIGIPIFLSTLNNREQVNEYIKQILKTDDYIVIKDKILFKHLAIYQGQKCEFTSASSKEVEIINATEFKVNKLIHTKYNDLMNFIFNKDSQGSNILPKKTDESITYEEFKKKCFDRFDLEINDFFDYLIDQIMKNYPLYHSITDKLNKVKNSGEFYKLNLVSDNSSVNKEKEISKVNIISEIFKMLKYDSSNANLKMLNKTQKFTDREGRIRKKIESKNGNNSMVLITQTYTGISERYYEF